MMNDTDGINFKVVIGGFVFRKEGMLSSNKRNNDVD